MAGVAALAPGEEGGNVERTGDDRGAGTDELLERDHDLRASLCAIEAVAAALNKKRARLRSEDVDRLASEISSKVRRLRSVLEQPDAMTDELLERDHELRASLFGIGAVAVTLTERREDVLSRDVDQFVLAIASEARRLRLMLVPRAKRRTGFDLAKAIRPAIVMTRAMGVTVHDTVRAATMVHGCRDDLAEVVFALLDNARVHAAGSPVDVRATSRDGKTVLFIEDRGPGIPDTARGSLFERGRTGERSSGSGLGLFIAKRLMVDQGGSLTAGPRSGGGASFSLSVPTSDSVASHRERRVAAQPSLFVR